jgi:hypothetical protein
MNKLFTFIVIITIISCENNDCEQLPSSFTSFYEAEEKISNADFIFIDNISTYKSSWIVGAKYYSCDNKTGFFILETENKIYIYQNLPIKIWLGFKNSTSFGRYYNTYIKNKYKLQLK